MTAPKLKKHWDIVLEDDALKGKMAKAMLANVLDSMRVLATTPNPLSLSSRIGYVKPLRTEPNYAFKPHTGLRRKDPQQWEYRIVFQVIVDGQPTDDVAVVCAYADTRELKIVAVGPRDCVYKHIGGGQK